MCLLTICTSSLKKCLFGSFVHLLGWIFVFLLSYKSFISRSGYQSLIRYMSYKYSCIPWVSFHFLDGVLCITKCFTFDEVQFICFFLHQSYFVIIYKKPFLNPRLQIHAPMFSYYVWVHDQSELIFTYDVRQESR